MNEELTCKVGFCFRCFGNKEQPTSILVYTMHQTDARVIDIKCLRVADFALFLKIERQSVEQGMFIVAMPRMDDQSCGLIDHQYVIVFVHHVDGNILRINGIVVRLMVE